MRAQTKNTIDDECWSERLRASFPVPGPYRQSSEQAICRWASTDLIAAARCCLATLRPGARLTCPEIRFDLRGLAAGKVHAERGRAQTVIRLNRQLFDFPANNYHELFDTITHEMAHVVILASALRDRPHGDAWLRVAQALGCNGSRCHRLPLKRAVRHQEHLYRFSECDQDYWLGPGVHRSIQNRRRQYRIRLNNGSTVIISPSDFAESSRRRD